jgi:hypothetical protein
LFAVVLLVVASLATRLVLRGGKQAPTLLQRGANLSGLPLVPFRRHDLAVFILNPVLCARRKLFEGPLDRRGLLHGCVPRPFIWHGLYVAVFSTTDTKAHRFLLLCEFARKKENPSLERFIASPFELFIASILLPAEALSTLRSFSAERPVIRGRGRSHALKLLIRS